MMKKIIRIWYFSGTGQCKRLAKYIAGNLTDNATDHLINVQDITSMTERNAINKNISCDQLILIFPIYANNSPEPMQQFLKELEGNHVPVMIFALWGNITKGNALYNTMKILVSRGFVVNGGAELVAEHSFVAEHLPITHSIAALDDLLNYIRERLALANGITISFQKESLQIKVMCLFPDGFMPRRIVKIKLNENLCNQCGNCIRRCPNNAVREDYTIVQKKCIRCLSCVSYCPNNARTHEVLGIVESAFKHEAAQAKKDVYYE